MPNEIKILVRTQNDSKAGQDAALKDVENFAKKSSETFSRTFGDNVERTVTERLRTMGNSNAGVNEAGDRLGDTIGRRASDRITTRITERIRDRIRGGSNSSTSSSSTSRSSSDNGGNGGDRNREHVSVSVDVDKQSFLQRMGALGKEASGKFGDAFKTGFGAVFNGDVLSTVIKGALVTFAGTVLAPVLGAAITSGVLLALGGGAIGAGVFAAIKSDPGLQSSFKFLADVAKGEFALFGKNFIGPVQTFADGLADVFNQMRPLIEDLGKSLGPVADDLAHGVIGFLQNVLPSIVRGMKASEPLIKVLADKLPGLGTDIGKLFDHISAGAPEAAQFFGDLIEVLGIVIRLVGNLIEGLTRMYGYARTVAVGMATLFLFLARSILAAADIAFGWIPGFGPKLSAAREKLNHWASQINNDLKKIPSEKTITLRFRIVGQAAASAAIRTARILAGMAHGGIKGAADGGMKDGLTWVGEQGPELVQLPPGSRVNTAGDSARMAQQGGGGGGGGGAVTVRLVADRTTEQGVVDALFKVFRTEISRGYGGDVQMALGS